ncbi:PQQ-like beta-propeller repeat protein [Planctomycetes bacterium K23_9]|uniref:Outer membrane biogenesis protein BamB n=1 Tax=Stieleria marina TaxID=1930275 RepID=A0A517NYE2_9BACT|nr:outer membrane biogenesis protein BamB [Planctomycetes bacterium K23_9]
MLLSITDHRPTVLRVISLALLATVLLVAGPQYSRAADAWPIFRGPGGNGVAPLAAQTPIDWSPTTNIKFRTPIPGQGWSSPVVAGDRIFVSAAIPRGDEPVSKKTDFDLSLIILDKQSGQIQKNTALLLHKGSGSPRIHKKNSHASPTPIVSDERIYVHFGHQGTVCVDLDGKVIWKNRDLSFIPVHGNGGTPVLVAGKLIFTCDGKNDPKIVALDSTTGKVAWEVERPVDAPKKFSFCTPTVIDVNGHSQVIAPGSNCVLAINPADGNVIWNMSYTGYSVIPKPVFHNGLVYLSTSYDSPSLLAIDPTGHGDVTDTHLKWSVEKNAPHTPSLIADKGLIYSISDGGIALCVDAETGDVVYKKRVGGGFSSSPVLVDDKIYYTDEAGVTTVIATGKEYKVLAENDLGERTLASMAVDGNALIMRTAEAIYRIEK